MPKKIEQIAALPIRWDSKDEIRVLMVTTRESGRWVVPKGWEMKGKTRWDAAAIEALEEAGVKGHVADDCIGTFRYTKVLKGGRIVPCLVRVYPMVVEKVMKNWKERHQRKRRWFTPKAAARRVCEPELAKVLKGLAKKPHKIPELRPLREMGI